MTPRGQLGISDKKDNSPVYSLMPEKLKGQKTTFWGVLSIVTGAIGLFANGFNAYHGSQIDLTGVTTSLGAVGTGVGLLRAADSKQLETK